MSKQRQLVHVCLVSSVIALGVLWIWYNKSTKDRMTVVEKKQKDHNRYTHFFSIRIINPLLIGLGQQIQNEISDEYKKNGIEIKSSLINTKKFHISLNILSLATDEKLNRFCYGLKLFENWLKTCVFNQQSSNLDNDEIFMDVITRNNYLIKFKDLYKKLLSSKDIDNKNGLSLYCEGTNHFKQSVIFLDFQNKFQIRPKSENEEDNNNHNIETQRNELFLQLLRMIHELIGKLCVKYKIKCDKKQFIPHCTLMKISKMKRREMKLFLKYNQTNDIYKIKLNDKNKKRGRNAYRVYDMNILLRTINGENMEKKMKLLQMEGYETVSRIDLCAMQGNSDDGYYKIIDSFSVVPDRKVGLSMVYKMPGGKRKNGGGGDGDGGNEPPVKKRRQS